MQRGQSSRVVGRLVVGLLAASLVAGAGCAAPDRVEAPPAAHDHDAGTRTIRVATWNIEWLSAREGDGEVRRQASDFEALAAHARRLDADVIALQEVDGEAAARRVFDPERYTFHFAEGGGRQRTGFAIDRDLEAIAHPDLTTLALNGLRPGADVTVRWNGGALRLLSVHLKARCAWDPLESSPACRTLGRQLPALEAWIDDRARGDEAFAVLGDFNRQFARGEAFWSEIDDGDPPGADLVNLTEGRRSRCRGGRHPRYVDHIVLDPRATAWLEPDSFEQVLYEVDPAAPTRLSDHCPIVATLRPR